MLSMAERLREEYPRRFSGYTRWRDTIVFPMTRPQLIVASLFLGLVLPLAAQVPGPVQPSAPPAETSAATSAKRPEEPAMSPPKHPETAYTNRLVNETSPYLLQHAHNPVDWYPWGEEALEKARREDKPIFLSIGYSACHWCHVMERESFENEAIAAVMNEHFVNIKVDREERPDLDEIYMSAVQAMTGSGGWPMSVWLTPELKPFYGGTYYPPESSRGMPGFRAVLERISELWNTRRDDVVQSANRLTDQMQQILTGIGAREEQLSLQLIQSAIGDLQSTFDAKWGGFGGAPKFPSSPAIQLLLREYGRTKNTRLLEMATLTLDKMAYGGMYDHLGGGFARYSTDARWLAPHFEKMLYDNAQLAVVYVEAYQLTGDTFYRHIAEEIFNYVLRDMTGEDGGFYSAEDADSEGEEGKFYLWEYDEIREALGEQEARVFLDFYNVDPDGNFQSHEHYHGGKNILHMQQRLKDFAADWQLNPENLAQEINAMREKLLAVRSERVRPGLDDKVLTSWNALMISAFAKGYQTLNDERYLDAATGAADFILSEMVVDGELHRTHRQGKTQVPAFLDDYAFLTAALIDLYETTFDLKWLEQADALSEKMIEKFWDAEAGGFYFTSENHTNLIVRTRPTYDGPIPSGNSMAALTLQRLAKLLDNDDYFAKAETILKANQPYMTQAPRGYLNMLLAVDFYQDPPKEIAVIGPQGDPGLRRLLETLHDHFVPNKVLASFDPGKADASRTSERIPLLAGKTLIDGKPAVYVCKNYACQLPVTTEEAMLKQLGVSEGETE